MKIKEYLNKCTILRKMSRILNIYQKPRTFESMNLQYENEQI